MVSGWINSSSWKATGNDSASACHDLSFDTGQSHTTFPRIVLQRMGLVPPGSGLRLFTACFPGKSSSWGRSHGSLLLLLQWVCSPFPCTAAEGASQGPDQGEARAGWGGLGRGEEGEEEEERPVRKNAGEDNMPSCCAEAELLTTTGEPVPWH